MAKICMQARQESRIRTGQLQTPVSERGVLWNTIDKLLTLFLQGPLFLVSFSGERRFLFDKLQEVNGKISPFVGGVAFHSYADIANILESKTQPRGQLLGARPVPDRCLDPSTLVYLSTGAEHTQLRQLFSTMPGLRRDNPAFKNAIVLGDEEDAGGDVVPSASTLKRTVVRNVWTRMFNEKPSDELTENLMDYFSAGATCVLGPDFHKYAFNYFLKKLDVIRAKTYEAVLATDDGKNVFDKLVADLGKNEEEAQHALQGLSDGFMFAGLIGTHHLTSQTFKRIKSDPHTYVPMWKRSPVRKLGGFCSGKQYLLFS